MRFGCPAALDGHDVVLVGYRGVDGSTRLDCPEVADIWRLQPDATARLVTGFLNGGVADANFDAAVPALKPVVRLPAVAKLCVAAVATAAAAVGTATWWTLGHR